MSLDEIIKELNKDEKIEFIRSVQGLYWTMTPVHILEKFSDEKIDNLVEFSYRSLPAELLDKTISIIKEKVNKG